MNPGCRNHLASHRVMENAQPTEWWLFSKSDYNFEGTQRNLNSQWKYFIGEVVHNFHFQSNRTESNQSINKLEKMILKAFFFLLTLPLSLVDIWNQFYIQIHSIFMYWEFSSFFPFHSCSVQLKQRQSLIQVGFNRTALHAEEAIMNHIIQVKTTITKKSIKLSFGLDANGSKIEFKL